MKIGIMGGTFDPIHMGHLIAAERAREGKGLDEVWFMPSYIPPHKELSGGALPEERLEMVKLAVSGCSYFQVIDIEIRRGGVSYTIDTVKELQLRYPEHMFHYIIGADMVQYLPKWNQIDELISRIGFIGLERPGFELDLSELEVSIRNKVTLVPMPAIEISSTDIRTRQARGSSIRYLVAEQVQLYIEGNGLYGS